MTLGRVGGTWVPESAHGVMSGCWWLVAWWELSKDVTGEDQEPVGKQAGRRRKSQLLAGMAAGTVSLSKFCVPIS